MALLKDTGCIKEAKAWGKGIKGGENMGTFRPMGIRHMGSQVTGDLGREEHEAGCQGDRLPLKEVS